MKPPHVNGNASLPGRSPGACVAAWFQLSPRGQWILVVTLGVLLAGMTVRYARLAGEEPESYILDASAQQRMNSRIRE